MKILVAVDDSPHSSAAIEEIARRPWPAGSTARVLSVVQPIGFSATDLWAVSWIDVEAAERHLTARAHEVAAQAAGRLQPAALPVDQVVRSGDPRAEIVHEAKQWDADLIVLGSHGYTGIKRLLLGSVAQYVVSHAPCSVEVVRGKGGSSWSDATP